MADKKLSALTALTGINTAAGDVFHILDISESSNDDKNKKITRDEMINMINPIATTYTPVYSAGFGTISANQVISSLHNDILSLWVEHTNGTPAATALTIGLPIGLKVAASYTNVTYLGLFQRDTVGTARYGVVATGGDIFLDITRLDTGSGAFVAMLGNAGLGTNEKQSFFVQLKVEAV